MMRTTEPIPLIELDLAPGVLLEDVRAMIRSGGLPRWRPIKVRHLLQMAYLDRSLFTPESVALALNRPGRQRHADRERLIRRIREV